MEERDGEVRWDGLCSRDAATRSAALDTIGQAVLRRAESIAPAAAADGLPVPAARDGLGQALARLLMLSRRCPFPDVREKSETILGGVQIQMRSEFVISENDESLEQTAKGRLVFCQVQDIRVYLKAKQMVISHLNFGGGQNT
ncbi:hypothetical protein WISP_60126 [Willisornis vidua]|uniref:Uncharacterized protein n=1 Tax=Willisornis vidua TaxID=1566151 RepID=A0ABQ9DB05_9PASS|nr:hypothetical protein WISP_60126 [Willisornis vidua]